MVAGRLERRSRSVIVATAPFCGYRRGGEAFSCLRTCHSTSATHSLAGSAWPWSSTRGCQPLRGPSASRSGRLPRPVRSAWFLLLFLLPVIAYRGLFAFVFDLGFRRAQPVEVVVEDDAIRCPGRRESRMARPSTESFRSTVPRTGSTWTVLHLDGTVLTIPSDAIALDQLDYLKSFAHRSALERKAAAASH